MAWTRLSIGVASATVIVSALLATLSIWLLMTDPAMLAAAADRGTVEPIAQALAVALVDMFHWLLRYL